MQETSSSDRTPLAINIDLDKLQAIRLCHAFLETDIPIHIAPNTETTFQYLRRFFDISYRVGFEGVSHILNAEIIHDQPYCNIGDFGRPLIFPKGMVQRCRSQWRTVRNHRYSFCGLVTPQRQEILNVWLNHSFPNLKSKMRLVLSPQRRLHKIFRREQVKRVDKKTGLCIYTSSKGRILPEKAWDQDYYDLLLDSQFVLCPDGDFVWTYRFFEAILCGAIPIVQNTCRHYEGFQFYTLDDDASQLTWSENIAEANFHKACEFLTVDKKILQQALLEAAKPV